MIIKVYETTTLEGTDYSCEIWGASTHHPDSIHKYSSWDNKVDFIEDKYQVFQWLLWLASCRLFPFQAKEVVEYAMANWYNWD